MAADTTAFRYPYRHTAFDTLDKVDCEKAARVVDRVRKVVELLADGGVVGENGFSSFHHALTSDYRPCKNQSGMTHQWDGEAMRIEIISCPT